MAEQEVIKHTKKIFGIWKTNNSFLHKLGEFLMEIFIIVFAITLSIYLHDLSVLKHQRHETKEFLLGLKQDLKTDIAEMEQDKKSFELSGKAFNYVTSRKLNEQLNPDSMNKHIKWMLNTTGLVPNSGRFEGFKSSGKIGTIENKQLQNDIMDVYQENIPILISSTDFYNVKKQKLAEYIYANQKRVTDSTTNLFTILASDHAFNISNTLILNYVNEVIDRYDICINKMKLIIDEINKEYGLEDKGKQ
ncbi:MAG: hypothetical protein ACM3H8_16730 [Sphingobacteriales bacterium]